MLAKIYKNRRIVLSVPRVGLIGFHHGSMRLYKLRTREAKRFGVFSFLDKRLPVLQLFICSRSKSQNRRSKRGCLFFLFFRSFIILGQNLYRLFWVKKKRENNGKEEERKGSDERKWKMITSFVVKADSGGRRGETYNT